MYVTKYSPYTNARMYCTCTGTSCSQHWSNRGATASGPTHRHNTDTVCDCGTEEEYLSTASTATTDWHYSACSVLYSYKVSDLISSCGDDSWRCPVDSDGGEGGVHSRETSGAICN